MKLRLISNCVGALVLLCACANQSTKQFVLPIFGEKHLGNKDTVYHTIGTFTLTNQHGELVTDQTTQGKIYVADFFFATCQSICPQMSNNLKTVQDSFKTDKEFLILCHTVNPLHDTVELLNGYSLSYGAIKGKWHFLTGQKKAIYDLARYGYLVNALEDDGTPEGFLHSELIVLVDKKGRIRGYFDGTNPSEVKKMINDIKLLKTEID
ncbi:MAG: SCO family protein [Bacteroidota bacterium]|jgi:protein SCO1/2|nr:SCO family protein [Bacteroidota bacterium]MCA6441793.1 SCO family protein [Bacteroidota bacterium]